MAAMLDLPKALKQKYLEGKVVFFVGAGVSHAPVTELMTFKELTHTLIKEAIGERPGGSAQTGGEIWRPFSYWERTKEELLSDQKYDRALGRLQMLLPHFPLHKRLEHHLEAKERKWNRWHSSIIKIARNSNCPRIITTNYDLFLEMADSDDFQESLKVWEGPALPNPLRFEGIVHLHGRVGGETHNMLVTDAEMGNAYVTDGWAARFMREICLSNAVVFVGYSINDPVFQYFTYGLPSDAQMYAFLPSTDFDSGSMSKQDLRRMGVELISHREDKRVDFADILETLEAWSELLIDWTTNKQGSLSWREKAKEELQKYLDSQESIDRYFSLTNLISAVKQFGIEDIIDLYREEDSEYLELIINLLLDNEYIETELSDQESFSISEYLYTVLAENWHDGQARNQAYLTLSRRIFNLSDSAAISICSNLCRFMKDGEKLSESWIDLFLRRRVLHALMSNGFAQLILSSDKSVLWKILRENFFFVEETDNLIELLAPVKYINSQYSFSALLDAWGIADSSLSESDDLLSNVDYAFSECCVQVEKTAPDELMAAMVRTPDEDSRLLFFFYYSILRSSPLYELYSWLTDQDEIESDSSEGLQSKQEGMVSFAQLYVSFAERIRNSNIRLGFERNPTKINERELSKRSRVTPEDNQKNPESNPRIKVSTSKNHLADDYGVSSSNATRITLKRDKIAVLSSVCELLSDVIGRQYLTNDERKRVRGLISSGQLLPSDLTVPLGYLESKELVQEIAGYTYFSLFSSNNDVRVSEFETLIKLVGVHYFLQIFDVGHFEDSLGNPPSASPVPTQFKRKFLDCVLGAILSENSFTEEDYYQALDLVKFVFINEELEAPSRALLENLSLLGGLFTQTPWAAVELRFWTLLIPELTAASKIPTDESYTLLLGWLETFLVSQNQHASILLHFANSLMNASDTSCNNRFFWDSLFALLNAEASDHVLDRSYLVKLLGKAVSSLSDEGDYRFSEIKDFLLFWSHLSGRMSVMCDALLFVFETGNSIRIEGEKIATIRELVASADCLPLEYDPRFEVGRRKLEDELKRYDDEISDEIHPIDG